MRHEKVLGMTLPLPCLALKRCLSSTYMCCCTPLIDASLVCADAHHLTRKQLHSDNEDGSGGGKAKRDGIIFLSKTMPVGNAKHMVAGVEQRHTELLHGPTRAVLDTWCTLAT